MSVLSKKRIIEKVTSGEITFKPTLDSFQLQEHAVDLRLGFTFMIPKRWHVTKRGREALSIDHFDPKRPQYFETVELEQGQYFEILPGEFVIVSTFESVKLPKDVMAILYPRSSVNRRGMSVDLTGIVDAGYEGQLVVPIKNNTTSQTIKLYPGERFCQLVFETLDSETESYHGRYRQADVIDGYILMNKDTGDRDALEIALVTSGDIKKLKNEHGLE